ncbi:lysophospholipase, putative [Plasmodium malariae]|uniref:Lysophospholipase, putative n=1 Tax=Plasmodium malariae TaxID=5858 RepID=A0A1A8WU66_PLAMA|nr:lysophospholipase, putative [Plasmodium malariae]SBS95397.1 unspecified product [Plasmodium malariae]SCO94215.1 lysophospholipase, putative [Plasmodium malariae]
MAENHLCDNDFNLTNCVDGRPALDAFYNKDGLLLRTYGWLVKNAIGIIILIHGLNSHARFAFLRHNVDIVNNDKAVLRDEQNYYVYKDSWIEHFNKSGYSVYGIDLQGHGKSDGWRDLKVNIKSYDDLVYDVIEYINKIQEKLSVADETDSVISGSSNICKRDALPTYIIGQSMGGNIALRTLQILGKSKGDIIKKLNIRGCISLSGMISIELMTASPRSYKYSCFYLPFAKVISWCFPRFRILSKSRYTRFPYMNDILGMDKMRYKKGITSRFGHELLKAMKILDRDIRHIPKDIPILFIHSKDDTLCYYRGVVSFFNRLTNDKKELHILENMEHMLSVEPGNENVLKKIMNWLSELSLSIMNKNDIKEESD